MQFLLWCVFRSLRFNISLFTGEKISVHSQLIPVDMERPDFSLLVPELASYCGQGSHVARPAMGLSSPLSRALVPLFLSSPFPGFPQAFSRTPASQTEGTLEGPRLDWVTPPPPLCSPPTNRAGCCCPGGSPGCAQATGPCMAQLPPLSLARCPPAYQCPAYLLALPPAFLNLALSSSTLCLSLSP